MNGLEIIHLRSSKEPIESLNALIRDSIKTEQNISEVVTLYRRSGLETDLAVHVRHREDSKGKDPSALASHLASELRAYGLVEHTLWEEIT